MTNLIKNPRWEKTDLGYPLPNSKHAVSVALPTWEDVIDYEEQKPECINSLKSIYPRFGLNPLLKKFIKELKLKSHYKDYKIWPYPHDFIALKAKCYCDRNTDSTKSYLEKKGNITLLITTEDASDHARSFWQHRQEMLL